MRPLHLRILLLLASVSATCAVQRATAQTGTGSPTAELVAQSGHAFDATFLVMPRDSRRVVSIGRDQTLKLWDLKSGLLIRSIEGFQNTAALLVTPDGGRAVTSEFGTNLIKVWDLRTGALVRTLAVGEHALTSQIALSPNGRMLFVGSGYRGDAAELWDIESGRTLLQASAGGRIIGAEYATFTTDAQQLIAASGRGAYAILEVPSGRVARTLTGDFAAVISTDRLFDGMALSPDNKFLVEAFRSSSAAILNVYNVATGKLLRTVRDVGGKDRFNDYVMLPGGKSVLSISRIITAPVRLIDLQTGSTLMIFEDARRAAISPDGKFLLTAQNYAPGNMRPGFKLWDFEKREVLFTFGRRGGLAGTALPINDSQIILNGARAGIWDMSSARLLRTIGEGSALSLISEGTRVLFLRRDVATTQSEFVIYDLNGAEPERHIPVAYRDNPRLERVRSDGRRIAAILSDGTVAQWDIASGTQVARVALEHGPDVNTSNPIWAMDISADLKRVIGTERPGKVAPRLLKIWDTESGRELFSLVDPSAQEVEYDGSKYSVKGIKASFSTYIGHGNWFSRNLSRIISVGDDYKDPRFMRESHSRMKIWDGRTGALLATSRERIANVFAQAFTSDSNKVYLGGSDGIIRVVDVPTANVIGRSAPQGGYISNIALTPDERRLILSISGGSFIRILDASSLQPLLMLINSDTGDWLGITPQGFFAGSEHRAQLLTVVRGFDVHSIEQLYQSLFNPDLVRETLAGDSNGEVREAAKVTNLDKVLDSGPAPDVTITSRPDRSQSATDLVTVGARITDKGTGIGRIEWRVNGITTAIASNPTGSGPDYSISQELALDPGENTIEVVVYNSSNLLASVPARTTVQFTGPAHGAMPKLHILAIGINDYTDQGWTPRGSNSGGLSDRTERSGAPPGVGDVVRFAPLALAVKDAQAFGTTMQRAAAPLYAEVRITYALDNEASRENLERTVERIAAEVHPRDTFVLFAAAHGTSVNGKYYLIPRDYQGGPDPAALVQSAIGQDRLQDWLANRIRARKAVILLDTCESGALIAGHLRSRSNAALSEAAVGRLHEATGRPVLTAAALGQYAYEGRIAGSDERHGLFTWAVLDALHNGDANHNGKIELSELVAHVQTLVPKLAAELGGNGRTAVGFAGSTALNRQTARFGSRGEDFVLANRLQ